MAQLKPVPLASRELRPRLTPPPTPSNNAGVGRIACGRPGQNRLHRTRTGQRAGPPASARPRRPDARDRPGRIMVVVGEHPAVFYLGTPRQCRLPCPARSCTCHASRRRAQWSSRMAVGLCCHASLLPCSGAIRHRPLNELNSCAHDSTHAVHRCGATVAALAKKVPHCGVRLESRAAGCLF